MARVSTYLNFPNNTEEVFNFYKTVFGTEFEGGIMRFGDIPPQEGQPPLADELKNLVIRLIGIGSLIGNCTEPLPCL